jgi:DNA-binding protein YbaB
MQARNAEMRSHIDSLMEDFRKRTQEIQERQAEAAAKTHEVTSDDGMVTVKVDANGTLQELTLSPKAFERSSPGRLAGTITSVIREASGSAHQYLREQFEPLTQDTPDLADLIPGAPSFKDILSSENHPLGAHPDPGSEQAKRTGSQPPESAPGPRSRVADDDYDDDPPDSFMLGGR